MAGGIKNIRKRDGRVQRFEPEKIENAIFKAFKATGEKDGKIAEEIAAKVVEKVNISYKGKIPDVEDIQDLVEDILIQKGYSKVAKAYILYRKQRADIRKTKEIFGVYDDLKLSVNATKVLQKRYLLRDDKGKITETPQKMFRRVARAIAKVDREYDPKADIKLQEEEFYTAMTNLEFLPNTPTLMNAGTALGQLSACFVIPVEDSLESIFEGVKNMALVQQSGGGTGFSFSRLRPKGDVVKSTKGVASGPVSFMKIFNTTTDVIKQGGKRRGANMGILRVDHPDIIEFINSKEKEDQFINFNISVAVTDEFMEAVKENKGYKLINPRTKKATKSLVAKDVFELLASNAWKNGDPGIIFIDEINRQNPTPDIGEIESTNPCGEVPLLPYESCNLGSINLGKMVRGTKGKKEVDWKKLKRLTRTGVHFLDNVIDANKYPVRQIEKITKANRKIGLGVMGFADLLIQLGIPYNSTRALHLAEKIMKFISEKGREMSRELAKERGSFPNFKGSIYEKNGEKPLRNATVTTIAPTGTISIIAGASSGIEPIFAISYMRNVMEGAHLLEVNPYFEIEAKNRGIYSESLMTEIARTGSIKNIEEIPGDMKDVYITAMDIKPKWHVRMQAAFQKYTDNAVSKTVNLPQSASLKDVRDIYWLAYRLNCKGITIYRYGSRKNQVLYTGPELKKERGENLVRAEAEYSGGCPTIDCMV